MERSARLSELFFPAPPRSLSYILMGAVTLACIVLLGADVGAIATATTVVLLPALLASVLGPPLAALFGRRFYHRRSAFLALTGAGVTGAGVVAIVLLGELRVEQAKVLYLTLGLVWVVRLAILSVVVDNRVVPSLVLSAIQPLASLPGAVGSLGQEALPVGLLLWSTLILPFLLMVRIFDAPLQRNFGISGSELFRAYLDHLTTQSSDAEALLSRIGEPVEARVGVVAFRRKDGSRKAAIAVPVVHPGPFGALGGGDLPAKMRDALSDWEHVLVPHAAANHDLNPVTTAEVERLGHYTAELAERTEVAPGGSRFVETGEVVRLGCQLFGPDALLTYTSWPEAIDDVDYGVGRGAELMAHARGAREAIFVDCHNSLRASAGAVFPLTPRALEIEKHAGEVATLAASARTAELKVGCASDRSLGLAHLVGRAGCQALVVEAEGQTTAYVLWDGNNMVPEATKAIRDACLAVVDEVRVMTTDNHAVNLEGGVYSPVGLRTPHERLAAVSRRAVEAAMADLEAVDSGVGVGHAPGILVVGHQKTAQLSASVNVMIAIMPEIVVALLGLWVLGVTAVFLAF